MLNRAAEGVTSVGKPKGDSRSVEPGTKDCIKHEHTRASSAAMALTSLSPPTIVMACSSSGTKFKLSIA